MLERIAYRVMKERGFLPDFSAAANISDGRVHTLAEAVNILSKVTGAKVISVPHLLGKRQVL